MKNPQDWRHLLWSLVALPKACWWSCLWVTFEGNDSSENFDGSFFLNNSSVVNQNKFLEASKCVPPVTVLVQTRMCFWSDCWASSMLCAVLPVLSLPELGLLLENLNPKVHGGCASLLTGMQSAGPACLHKPQPKTLMAYWLKEIILFSLLPFLKSHWSAWNSDYALFSVRTPALIHVIWELIAAGETSAHHSVSVAKLDLISIKERFKWWIVELM